MGQHINENQQGPLYKKQYTEVKAQVPISIYCRDMGITELKPAGLRLVGLCPFHEEKTPSFTVYGDSSYYCFGCAQWGDVIKLHAYADGHDQPWTAMRDLAERYNVELPRRPERWRKWTCEKARRRGKAREALISSYQRRYFKLYGEHLKDIADEAERKAEAAKFYEDLYPLAYLAAKQHLGEWDG